MFQRPPDLAPAPIVDDSAARTRGLSPNVPAQARPHGIARVTTLRTFDALDSRSFAWFFASMLSQFSSMHMQMVVTPWLVYELTGSYAALGTVALVSAVPGLILGFVGGVVADRAPKKIVVQAGQLISGFATLAVAVLLAFGMLGYMHLLALSALQGAVFAIVGPTRQAWIPEIVGSARLTNAVALNMAGLNVTRMGVPAIGGLLIALIGPAGVFFVMAALIFVAMVTLAPVRRYADDRGSSTAAGDEAVSAPSRSARGTYSLRGGLRDVVDGLRYIAADRVVFVLLLVNFFIVLMSMPYMQMMAGFVKEVLGAGPEQLGVLWSVTGIGSLAGSLAIASMPSRGRGKVFLISALILGIALLAFAVSTWFWVTAAIMVFVGVGQAGRMSLGNILVMDYTAPEYQGRVMSVFMMEFSLVSFGTFLVGILASIFGIQWAIGGTALALVAVAIVGLLWVPRLRDLP